MSPEWGHLKTQHWSGRSAERLITRIDCFGRRAPNHHVYERVTAAFRNNHKCETLPTTWIDFRWVPPRRGPRVLGSVPHGRETHWWEAGTWDDLARMAKL